MSLHLKGQSKPCIAYRTNGELRANCDGRDALLLKRPGLASFAIGVDGGTVLGDPTKAFFVRDGKVSSLPLPADTWTHFIYQSCGAALAPQTWLRGPTIDVITGKPTSFAGLVLPQCSADRSLIVGFNKAGEVVTNSGKILAASSQSYSFAVSPLGRWAAIVRIEPTQLCIYDTHDWRGQCFGGDDNDIIGSQVLSVSNAGDVLVEEGTDQTCWTAAGGAIESQKKFPGAKADQCFGVAVATPQSAPRLIIPVGFRPAWVDKKVLQAQFGVFK